MISILPLHLLCFEKWKAYPFVVFNILISGTEFAFIKIGNIHVKADGNQRIGNFSKSMNSLVQCFGLAYFLCYCCSSNLTQLETGILPYFLANPQSLKMEEGSRKKSGKQFRQQMKYFAYK